MTVGPRSIVVAPKARPPVTGLLASFKALTPDDAGDRWENGFAFVPEQCAESGRDAWSCSQGGTKSIPANPAIVDVDPFFVWAGDKCSPFDRAREWQARTDRLLAATESFQVAAELWTGSVAAARSLPNQFLTNPDSDTLNDPVGNPMGVVDALACLEYALGRCQNGGRGVIHCTTQLATHWSQHGMVRREGPLVLTLLDTIVVADAGYDGTGPAHLPEAGGSQWAYATGTLAVRLGDVQRYPRGDVRTDAGAQAEAIDKDTNLISVRSERSAAVSWDSCCHLAVEVDLPLCNIGGAS